MAQSTQKGTDFGLSVGTTSTHGASQTTAMGIGLDSDGFALSGYSAGLNSKDFYFNSYLLSGLWTGIYGQLAWMPLGGGIGIGGFYAERGMLEEGVLKKTRSSNLGITTRVRLFLIHKLHITFEVFHGHPIEILQKRLSTREVIFVNMGYLM